MNKHCSSRKMVFIIQLSNILIINFKVCIMGDGWNQIRNHISKKFLVNPPYKDYGSIYRKKRYYNPSLVEGGPISLVSFLHNFYYTSCWLLIFV